MTGLTGCFHKEVDNRILNVYHVGCSKKLCSRTFPTTTSFLSWTNKLEGKNVLSDTVRCACEAHNIHFGKKEKEENKNMELLLTWHLSSALTFSLIFSQTAICNLNSCSSRTETSSSKEVNCMRRQQSWHKWRERTIIVTICENAEVYKENNKWQQPWRYFIIHRPVFKTSIHCAIKEAKQVENRPLNHSTNS